MDPDLENCGFWEDFHDTFDAGPAAGLAEPDREWAMQVVRSRGGVKDCRVAFWEAWVSFALAAVVLAQPASSPVHLERLAIPAFLAAIGLGAAIGAVRFGSLPTKFFSLGLILLHGFLVLDLSLELVGQW